MLLIINLPLIGMWVRLLKVPYRLMFPAILIFCSIGVYSINNAPADCIMVAAFGLVGYWLRKMKYPLAPLVVALVLGDSLLGYEGRTELCPRSWLGKNDTWEELEASVRRALERDPERLLLTHGGPRPRSELQL